jgi:mRNA interferase MazF
MTEYYRGDIFYITPFYTVTGSEQRAGRPGVIVSNDANNKYSPNVEIVFLTSQEKKPLPTHVPVMCRVPSTALCENIQTVSKERLSTFIKSCTTKELKNIDNALLVSLGINSPLSVGGGIEENAPQKSTPTEVERDLYKTLYEQILDKLVGGNTND